jgi:DegV family protein with EDD domain
MKNRVAIVTDTGCDIPDHLAKEHDIRIVPLRVLWRGRDFRDRYEVKSSEIFKMMDEEIPTTSLPNQEDFLTVMDQLADEGWTQALFITISSCVSGTYNAVRLWAEEYERMKVTVLDSKALTMAQGGMAIEAAKVAKAGGSLEEVVKRAQEIRSRVEAFFVVRTLEYLKKGGRISAIEGTLGSLLHIRPVIVLEDSGTFTSAVKAKGFKRTVGVMMDQARQKFSGKRIHLTAVHCENEEGAKQLAEEVRTFADVAECFVIQLNPTMAVHTGRGLLGLVLYELD